MRTPTLRTVTTAVALAVALSASGLAAQGSAPTLALATGEGWVDRDAELEVRVAEGDGRLAFVLDDTDLTDLFRRTPGGWAYRGGELPLPVGEHTLRVFAVAGDGSWRPLGELPLRVRSQRGFTARSAGARLDLDLHAGLVDDDVAGEGSEDAGGDLRIALDSLLGRAPGRATAQVALVGTSDAERALRAGRDDSPDRFDLASYHLELGDERRRLGLGHTTFGTSPYLIDGFAGRGLSGHLAVGHGVELAAAVLSGSQVVGWSDVLGLERADHRIATGSVGAELVPERPGALRLELAYLDGSVAPLADFGQGAVDDAEESDGWSLRLVGAALADRLRWDGGWARSRFRNPADPFLDQGADVVPVAAEERDARHLRLDWELFRSRRADAAPRSLSLGLGHSRVDPLYRSVATYAESDVERDRADLDLRWGGLSAQAFHQRSHDNLDDVPSILTTATRTTGGLFALPLGELTRQPDMRWPTLQVAYQRVHQAGEGIPTNGGFAASHVPDQVSASLQVALEWLGTAWQTGLRLEDTRQDNRQPGRETADFETSVVAATGSFVAGATLDVGLEASHERFRALATDEVSVTDRVGVFLTWRPLERFTWSGNLGWSRDTLRPVGSTTDSLVLDSELLWRAFAARRGEHGVSGQLYLRLSSDDTDHVDRLFGLDQRQRVRSVVSGLTLGLH